MSKSTKSPAAAKAWLTLQAELLLSVGTTCAGFDRIWRQLLVRRSTL